MKLSEHSEEPLDRYDEPSERSDEHFDRYAQPSEGSDLNLLFLKDEGEERHRQAKPAGDLILSQLAACLTKIHQRSSM